MTNPAPVSTSVKESVTRRDTPPLRIHHIMAAMAVVGVLLSINHSMRLSESESLSVFGASVDGNVLAINSGLAATLVGLGVVWRHRGHPFFDQPGHWLLLGQSLYVGFFLVAGAIIGLQLSDRATLASGAIMTFFVLLNLMMIVFNLWAARRIADSIPWTLVFLLDGLSMVTLFGIAWLLHPDLVWLVIWGAPTISIVLLLLAAWGDRRDYVRRDWPHWIGVCLRIVPTLQILGRPLWGWIAGSFTA
jgi:hypothetical protein